MTEPSGWLLPDEIQFPSLSPRPWIEWQQKLLQDMFKAWEIPSWVLSAFPEGTAVWWQPIKGKPSIKVGKVVDEFEPGLFQVDSKNETHLVRAKDLHRVNPRSGYETPIVPKPYWEIAVND